MIQRIARDVRRFGLTSTGTWYVEPPTRRDLTSRAGLTFSRAFLNVLERVVLGLPLDLLHGAVEDPLGGGLLPALHDGVDELGDQLDW